MAGRFVVDNSVVMAWCFRDESSPYASSVLESLERWQAVVPTVWPFEVGNVLAVAERRRRLERADSMRFLELLGRLPLAHEPSAPGRALGEVLDLARSHALSTYDAAYLDLAMRLGLPMATLDRALAGAAKKAGVALFKP